MLVHTTKIRTLTYISRARLLPRSGDVSVRRGDKVKPTQVIARAFAPGGLIFFDAATQFGMTAKDVAENLLVREGEIIERGTPLLRRSSLLDRSKEISSPVDGVLTKVYDGNLIIQQSKKMLVLRPMIQGKVVSVIPGRGAVIETLGSLVQAVWDSGKEAIGKIAICTNNGTEELDSHSITAEMQRSIIVAGMVQNEETLKALEEKGARGLIVGSISGNLRDRAKKLAYPVFVTDGFGGNVMTDAIFDLLKQNADFECSLFSSNLGGERLLRSEIAIAKPEASTNIDKELAWKSAEVGDTIRIINVGGSSQIGTVVVSHSDPVQLPSGSWVMGSDVEISSGEVIFVPYSNMDMII